MKRGHALLILLLLPLAVMSQRLVQKGNFFTMWVSGGYSNFMHTIPDTKADGLGGGALGVGYEYQYGKFFLNLGAEFSYLNSISSMNMDQYTIDGVDTEGQQMEYHYNFSQFNDLHSAGYVSVPFALGFKTNYFYMSVGAKLGYAVMGSSKTTAKFTTTSTYKEFFEDFVGMPDHFLGEYSSSATEQVPYNLNVSGTFEMGWYIGPDLGDKKAKWRYKLGVFAEYGFLSMHSSENAGDVLTVNPENLTDVAVRPLFLRTPTKDYSINPLYVGVKFTALLRLPDKEFCFCIDGHTKAKRIKTKKR